MSFSRHREIYHFDEGAIPADHALAHRTDEFPAGYSSAGCSPASPASASPASAILLGLVLNAKDFAANGKLSLVTVSHPRGSLQMVTVIVARVSPPAFSALWRHRNLDGTRVWTPALLRSATGASCTNSLHSSPATMARYTRRGERSNPHEEANAA